MPLSYLHQTSLHLVGESWRFGQVDTLNPVPPSGDVTWVCAEELRTRGKRASWGVDGHGFSSYEGDSCVVDKDITRVGLREF
jgi:hypothetical protein